MKLKGRVAIVTGGASGLGEATVRELVREGVRVMIADLNDERGKDLVKELGPQNVAFFTTNVTDEENVIKLVQETVKAFGAVHIVVNSAGVAYAVIIAATVSRRRSLYQAQPSNRTDSREESTS